MTRRPLKALALIAAGGILLQTGGCTTLLFQIVGNQIFTSVLRSIIQGVLGTGGSTTTTP